ALAYLLLLCAGILLVIRVVAGLAPAGAAVALPLLMLEITLSLTVSVAGGARFSSVTKAIVAVGVYGVSFIGGFVEQIGGFAGISSMRTIGVLVSLVSPADSMWGLGAQYKEAEVMRSTGILALGAAVPTAPMVWWAAGYTVLTLLYGVAAFRRRALEGQGTISDAIASRRGGCARRRCRASGVSPCRLRGPCRATRR